MNRVRMLKHFGITPYLVFDGGYLPSKAITETSRSQRRQECKKTGLQLLKAGKPSQAQAELQKAIDVTPEMARHLIEELKKTDVRYVVAPYEADPQLVYLERQGHISGIISEDSDLLVFGAKRLLTKLDQYGKCIEIHRSNFCSVREVSLTGWTDAQFRQMAIFSGCDYLDSINNLGLKTAHRLMRKHKTPEKVVRMLQFDGKYRVPADYLTLFHQAEQTFLHQWVFCPKANELVHFTDPGPDIQPSQLPFIGPFLEPEIARGVAVGDLNPVTKQTIVIGKTRSPRKRTASVAAYSAPAARAPRQPANKPGPGDSDLKRNGRIPLGEMEPNCFEVDTRRLSDMTDNGNQSIVWPLPRPYIDGTGPISSSDSRPYINQPGSSSRALRRRTEPVANLLSRSGRSLAEPRRQTIGPVLDPLNNLDSAGTSHPVRPPKKARLCDDASTGQSPSKKQSKFFSPKNPKGKQRRDGYLMSDDSVEEALRDLPDIDGWGESSKGQKEITIFQESANSDISPVCGTTDSGRDVPASTQSLIDSFAYAPASGHDQSRRQSTSTSSSRDSIMGLTPASSITSSTPFSSYTQPSTSNTTPATPRLTPLQRLGIQALGRRQPSAPTFPSNKPLKRSSLGRQSLESLPITNPAFVPLPRVDLAEVEALHEPRGSEDLMMSDSDNDEDRKDQDNFRPRGGNKGGTKLDLSMFRFA